MLEKINGKKKLLFHCLIALLFLILIYSRFVGLNWGLPYPMHPDERNMAMAIEQLRCQPPVISLNLPKSIFGNWEPVTTWLKIVRPFDFLNCFNPHFFAYGQLPLYLGYLVVYILKFFDGDLGFPINFQEATISLRIISAVTSVINVFILFKIIKLIFNFQFSKLATQLLIFLILIFSPYAIQFAHFGTTESLLMMFYSAIIYYSLLFVDKKIDTLSFVVNSSILVGLSLATKVSSLIFLITPFLVLLFNVEFLKQKSSALISKNSIYLYGYKLMNKMMDLVILVFISLIVFFIFSPHNFINLKDFISSMNYESDVALGKSLVFYTRQFFSTKPFYFQLEKIFPFALGWPAFILGSLGFIGLSWKDKKINLLRFAFLIYFIPSAMIYAKWSRFMAPVFPIILIFAILFILNIKNKILKIHIKYQNFYILICNFAFCVLIFAMILPGISYLSIYQNPDVRFHASDWIYKNIPNNSYLLFETANVVDIPIPNPKSQIPNLNYQTVSFNFYDLDQSLDLQSELINHIEKADYIFIPSRRIFANHPKEKYLILNKYYEDLFSGKLGFKKVAEFNSFPKICWPLNNKCLVFDDEQAEETWTVFDHPVIRIYKKIKSS
ncbi:MAG: glycosyltransferase family 39 protein [Patescibacteria group bacterium]|jgi:hypothetical protein